MFVGSDATIELKDRWTVASTTARRRFRELVKQGYAPRSDREPYAAVIRIWLGLCPEDRQEMLNWMDSRLQVSQ